MLQSSTATQSIIPEHLITGLCLLLLLAGSLSMAYQGAAFWSLLHSQPYQEPAPQAPLQPSIDPQQLAMLFGEPLPDSSGPAPVTSLQLTLLAAFNHPQGSRSSAIIGQAGLAPKRFLVGEAIAHGVTLDDVQRQHVTLLRNGRRESLHFPERSSQTLTAAATPVATGLLSRANQP